MILKDQLAMEIAALGVIYNRETSEHLILLYLADLLPHGEKAITAIHECRKKHRFFPTIADILAEIPGEQIQDEDVARDVANRIWEAIGKFGWCNRTKAKDHIGGLGWTVVEKMGGWDTLCMMSTDERGTFVAQARDYATSLIRLGRGGQYQANYQLPSPANTRLFLQE